METLFGSAVILTRRRCRDKIARMSFTTALAYLAGITLSFLTLIFGTLWLVGYCRGPRKFAVDESDEPEVEKKLARAARV